MSLNDLSARELARIDSICLEYESKLRDGLEVPVNNIVERFGGDHPEILRTELEAIREEVQLALNPPKIIVPFQISRSDAQQSSKGQQPHTEEEKSRLGQPLSTKGSGLVSKSKPVSRDLASDDSGWDDASTEQQRAKFLASGDSKLPNENDQIGPYTIGRMIGRGGMGVVYKAIDTRLGREVAIKFLNVSSHHQELNNRFEGEARAVAALSNPHIVELFDVGAANGLPFAVMELMRGQTLDERLMEGKLRASDVRELGAQIASALATAHEKEVIHRDLKPQNIMLLGEKATLDRTPDEEASRFEKAANRSERLSGIRLMHVKVFDFGLSRIETPSLAESNFKTREGMILGTPGYMSPEQARGQSATAAADIYSLGCILFEAFYGRPAINGETTAARFAATMVNEPAADPVRRRDDVELADLIQECLATDPADRPFPAADLADRLRNAVRPVDPILGNLQSGYSRGEIVRRHFLTLVGGALAGSAAGSMSFFKPANKLLQIKSLAVLSIHPSDWSGSDESKKPILGLPVSDRTLDEGEMLSSALVHELSKLDSISVQPFRSMWVNDRQELIDLGKQWGVDAFITGTADPKTVAKIDYLLLDIQIVSATTGEQLDSFRQRTVIKGTLTESSELAREFAQKIEKSLTPEMLGKAPPNPDRYRCLIDGKVRVDPDSVSGLERSLECLEHAAGDDDLYVEPIAGVALTCMLLAIQADEKADTAEYVEKALRAFEKALTIDSKAVDARLARAMHAWQTLGDYDEAEMTFEDLIFTNSNHSQVRHQYGLLMLAMGKMATAKDSLLRSTRLNPMSAMLRMDKARASWYSGNIDSAKRDASLELTKYPDSTMARGLLIDLLEQEENWREAASQDEGMPKDAGANRERYFEARRSRLQQLPYLPYGRRLNEAIWQARNRQFTQAKLADLALPTRPPMLPLLLAVHPAFAPARFFDQAKDELLYRKAPAK